MPKDDRADYSKLRELCPEIENVDEELRKALPSVSKHTRELVASVDSIGREVRQQALEAQPELLERERKVGDAIDKALRDPTGTPAGTLDAALDEDINVRTTALNQLRSVCRTPTS